MDRSAAPINGSPYGAALAPLRESRMLRSVEYEPLIQALFRATDYGVLMTDLKGTDILCNPRFGILFGLEPEQVVQMRREEVRRMALARVKDPEGFNTLIE